MKNDNPPNEDASASLPKTSEEGEPSGPAGAAPKETAAPAADASRADPNRLAEDLETAKKERDEAREEAARYHDKWLRGEAELDNYRKRVQKERHELFLYGHEKIVLELLPVLDNLERALDHAKEMGLDRRVLEGVELTCRQFADALAKVGVVPFPSLGKAFDPGTHEAIMEEESTERPPRTVIKEIEKGYMLRDRLLRPARVVLAKAPKPSPEAAPPEGADTAQEKGDGYGNG